jgi:hypothetical protein
VFDLEKINELLPFLERLGGENGNSMFLYIVLLGLGVLVAITILLKILRISMRRADEKCLRQFDELLNKQK